MVRSFLDGSSCGPLTLFRGCFGGIDHMLPITHPKVTSRNPQCKDIQLKHSENFAHLSLIHCYGRTRDRRDSCEMSRLMLVDPEWSALFCDKLGSGQEFFPLPSGDPLSQIFHKASHFLLDRALSAPNLSG